MWCWSHSRATRPAPRPGAGPAINGSAHLRTTSGHRNLPSGARGSRSHRHQGGPADCPEPAADRDPAAGHRAGCRGADHRRTCADGRRRSTRSNFRAGPTDARHGTCSSHARPTDARTTTPVQGTPGQPTPPGGPPPPVTAVGAPIQLIPEAPATFTVPFVVIAPLDLTAPLHLVIPPQEASMGVPLVIIQRHETTAQRRCRPEGSGGRDWPEGSAAR